MSKDTASGDIVLDDGLDLSKVVTTGSVLRINEICLEDNIEDEKPETKGVDFIGEPVKCFSDLEKHLLPVDKDGYVKKKVLEDGGGEVPHDGCTVSIVYSGYWEDTDDPFDVRPIHKPLVVDLSDNGLLPGLIIAVKSMLVGEISVFLLSHHLMYGEMGIPPRIKPKASCVFYIKLVKNIITPKQGDINFSEANMFQRVHKEVKLLYSSGMELHKTKNYSASSRLFRKAVFMLHRVRLADEDEEKIQEKFLIKLYTNLAICYNKLKLPLKACTACNEINRLTNIWSNGKVLFQNAKALRMIGAYDSAEKRLKRAMQLFPNKDEMKEELELLQRTREACNQSKLIAQMCKDQKHLVSKEFKDEVDNLIKNFKQNENLCKFTLPTRLHDAEVDYIREVCQRENIFCNKIERNFALDKDERAAAETLGEEFNDLLL
ncbi:inactive peptidyl-prolyl cis-trans isomerase shutdown [Plutella xylostella]|uniref:inactive peptidyl-prolyl cis-trans isomerase shutdown n=1 Tax=Plutella xylostella TaxID=51655 RepID=UPI0020322A92|nr:inactive peptidyl-prolyl cis-trans isomerase shutdown [Plutella xylostella]